MAPNLRCLAPERFGSLVNDGGLPASFLHAYSVPRRTAWLPAGVKLHR